MANRFSARLRAKQLSPQLLPPSSPTTRQLRTRRDQNPPLRRLDRQLSNPKPSNPTKEKPRKKNYKTHSEKKSAFAKRNIRSLKSIIYKNLEFEWTYSYIEKLQGFVQTINSRVNRVTKLAPNKVT